MEEVLQDYLFDETRIIKSDSVKNSFIHKKNHPYTVINLIKESLLIDLFEFQATFDNFDEFSYCYDYLSSLRSGNVAEFYTANKTSISVQTFKPKLEELEQVLHEASR